MNLESFRQFLLWCTLINMGLLLYWFAFFAFARDFIYRIHSRWFRLNLENFDAINYSGMALFKLGIFLFNLVPYIVVRFCL